MALNLKIDEGREILLRLVRDADVFLTNFLPGVLDRLDLGVDKLREVNPRLIYARGHGFGVRGADADRPGFDATAFWARGAVADALAPEGLPEPLGQRGALGDRYGGTQLAFGVAAALFRRERTGEGSVVDVSLLSTAMWMIGSDVVAALAGSFTHSPQLGQPRTALSNPLAATYRSADGRWLMLNCLQPDRYWAEVCRVIDHEDLVDDARFADMDARTANTAALVVELEAAFAAQPLDVWSARLTAAGIPWGPFQTVEELIVDPQVAANGYLATVQANDGTEFQLPAGAVQFDEHPAAIRRAPELGEHTDELVGSLGYSWDEIVALKLSGAIL